MEHRPELCVASGDCEEEKTTQHYLGGVGGIGPVHSDETVLFAVFDDTPMDKGAGRLWKEAFPTKQLVRSEVSLARKLYTSAAEFLARVVQPATERHGQLIGIARARVRELRALTFVIPTSKPSKSARAFCVIDKVGPTPVWWTGENLGSEGVVARHLLLLFPTIL
jgi:hypothetical protein